MTYTTGLPKSLLGSQYSLHGLITLFFRCQIFDNIENLSGREFLDKDGAKKVGRTLENLRQVFFLPLSEEETEKRQKAIDDSLLEYLARSPHTYGAVHDLRKLRK